MKGVAVSGTWPRGDSLRAAAVGHLPPRDRGWLVLPVLVVGETRKEREAKWGRCTGKIFFPSSEYKVQVFVLGTA